MVTDMLSIVFIRIFRVYSDLIYVKLCSRPSRQSRKCSPSVRSSNLDSDNIVNALIASHSKNES